ncbi:MAG: transposase, partial [Gemmatimonadales bacterium]
MPTEVTGGRRRSIRLPQHDYAAEAGYMVTLCTHKRAHLFGEIRHASIRLSPVGQLVQDLWLDTARVRPGVTLDAFVVMP